MMKSLPALFWAFLLVLTACGSGNQQPEGASEKTLQEIKQEGPISNADIIRNPVSADTPIDTVNVAKVTFEEQNFEFGEVTEGDVIEHSFKFRNTGKAPLVIQGARSTCGCTVPEWPTDPIPVGEEGEIFVRFNTKNKRARQVKPVIITANSYPATTKVYLRGFVNEAGAEQ
ncbi:MAG: DUF1573 domain-containing protein [Phaeodactylibacter sp.]|uniref:DUF1573 domain-containing protein n=1 Tax=Phaeodactylibacter sp. TaxID=1940289 RepID=UPI0032EAA89A